MPVLFYPQAQRAFGWELCDVGRWVLDEESKRSKPEAGTRAGGLWLTMAGPADMAAMEIGSTAVIAADPSDLQFHGGERWGRPSHLAVTCGDARS